jgi:hypothetical protein
MSEDYELGFADGERAAWAERNAPLPAAPVILNERMRGYWDARLPRTARWTRRQPISQAWWEDRQHVGAR